MSKRKLRKTDKSSDNKQPEPLRSPIPASSFSSVPTSSARFKFQWRPFFVLAGIILLVVIVCFANTLGYGMVFNDRVTMGSLKATDPDFWPGLWARALVAPMMEPWLRASFAKDMADYGTNFGWYHLVNVFLHLSASLALAALVLRVAWRLRNDEKLEADPYKIAAAAGIIFACHPLVVQTASYISARYASLGAANFLLAMNFFLIGLFGRKGAPKIWGYILTIFFGFMALNANETGVLLPAALLALYFVVGPKSLDWKDWAIEHPVPCGLLIVLCVATPLLYFNGFEPACAPDWYGMPGLNKLAYTATQAKAFLTYYTRLVFVPIGISVDPPYAVASGWNDPLALLGAALGAGLLYATVRFRRNIIFVFGMVFVFAGYLAHACIVQQESVADPVFYLSLAGFAIVIGWFLSEILPGDLLDFGKKLCIVVVILMGLSIWRDLDWASDEKLFAATLRTNENSAMALTWSSLRDYRNKDYVKAISLADQALVLDPKDSLAYFAKGSSLRRSNKLSEALPYLQKAQIMADKQHSPMAGTIKLGYAEALIKSGKTQQANPLIYEAMAEEPGNPQAVYLTGLSALSLKSYQPATMYLQRAAQMGIADALVPLTESAIRSGNYDLALAAAQGALKYEDDADSEFAAGSAQYAKGLSMKDAMESFKKVLKAEPKNTAAMAFLSLVYERLGDAGLAESFRTDALKADPAIFSKLALPKDTQKKAGTQPEPDMKIPPNKKGAPSDSKKHRK